MMKNEVEPAPDASVDFEVRNRRASMTVVGLGNEFRGDDSAGLLTIRKLKEKVPAEVRTAELMGDQSNLLELMRSTDAMVIVDAVRSSSAAGTVFRVDASQHSIPEDFFTFSTHAFDAAQVVELARILRVLPKKVIFYGIVGKEFSYSPKLSTDVEEAVDIVQTSVLKDIRASLKSDDFGLPRKGSA